MIIIIKIIFCLLIVIEKENTKKSKKNIVYICGYKIPSKLMLKQ